jgi:hypothetical protein
MTRCYYIPTNLVAQPDESLFKLTPAELAAAARRLLPVDGLLLPCRGGPNL